MRGDMMKDDILFNIKELHHLIGKTMFNDNVQGVRKNEETEENVINISGIMSGNWLKR